VLPGQKNFNLYQGDTYIIPVRLREVDSSGNSTPIDLTDHTPKAEIRTAPGEAVVEEFEVVKTDAANGELELRLAHPQTTGMTGTYSYDLQTIVDDEGTDVVRTWLRGEIRMTREITT
jgi:hypothetical protein